MRRLLAAALVAAATLAAGAAPAQTPTPPPPPDAAAMDGLLARSRAVMADGMVGSAVVHALYAETARALLDVFAVEADLPARQAADELAAWLMLPADRSDPRFVRIAEIVQVWLLLDRRARATAEAMPFWAARGFARPQYEAMMCLVWGRGPGVFRTLAQRAGLAADAQPRCVEAVGQADARWRRLLEAQLAADTTMGPGRMAMTVDWQVLALGGPLRALRESAMLEMVADQITASFVLPTAIAVQVQPCAEPTATWRAEDGAIVLCEGLIEAFDRAIRPAFVSP